MSGSGQFARFGTIFTVISSTSLRTFTQKAGPVIF